MAVNLGMESSLTFPGYIFIALYLDDPSMWFQTLYTKFVV